MDQESQQLFREIGIGTRLKRLAEFLSIDGTRLYAEAGVTFRVSQFYAVYALAEQGPMTINRLVSLSRFSQSAVSQTLKKLEQEGLIRFCVTDDARERCAELTDAGEDMASRLRALWSEMEQAIKHAVEESGYDFFAALDALEQAFWTTSFYDRVMRARARPAVAGHGNTRKSH